MLCMMCVHVSLACVQLFIRGPGIAPGTKIDHMVANIDIGPTLLDLAGVPVPPIMDGQSMVPLLTGLQRLPARPLHG